MNMVTDSTTPYSESVKESLVMEVSDMRNLTGIIPEPLTQLTSTTSLVGYPRQSPRSWGMTILEEDQAVMTPNHQTMMQEIKVVPTRSKGYINPRCLGSTKRNDLGNQSQTPAASRPKILSISSKETLPPSKDESDVL